MMPLCAEFHCGPVQEWTAEERGLCTIAINWYNRGGPWSGPHAHLRHCMSIYHSPSWKDWTQAADRPPDWSRHWSIPCPCTQRTMFFPICHIFHSRRWGHSRWNPGIPVVRLEWNIAYQMHSHPGPSWGLYCAPHIPIVNDRTFFIPKAQPNFTFRSEFFWWFPTVLLGNTRIWSDISPSVSGRIRAWLLAYIKIWLIHTNWYIIYGILIARPCRHWVFEFCSVHWVDHMTNFL